MLRVVLVSFSPCLSATYNTAGAGGHDVLVHGLAWEPLAALTVLAGMAEHDSGPVWESLVKFSGAKAGACDAEHSATA